ncbi:MAG: hypothetical protein LUG51_16280 [Tannerellaceae bacterium]|nr:hypothetical protein [Tannerellaceae bacterium]
MDPDCIMISGSSAGAVTVLQADYYLNNKMHSYEILPAGFQYAGVLSFAGAIFSHQGTPDYKEKPAPTLFLHGDKDKVVFYNKLRLFRRGMFGSKPLAKRFKKREFNYLFITMKNKGHSVSGSPMHNNLDIIEWFIQNYVYEKKNWQNEGCMKELNTPIEAGGSVWAL